MLQILASPSLAMKAADCKLKLIRFMDTAVDELLHLFFK